jgi:hypothetical protein
VPAQREAIAQLAAAVHNYDVLKAKAQQDPSSYDAWTKCGYLALEIAMALTSTDEGHYFLEEVCNATC